MKDVKVDPEFRALVFPLAEAEAAMLEESLLREGCRDALVTWRGLLLDGHHRLEICRKHSLEFKTKEVELEDRTAAKVWVIKNQFARRNLTPFQRAELALRLEPLIAEKAREKQREAGGAVPQKSAKAVIDTREELASIAGVSHDTIWKTKFILRRASDEVKENLRKGETTINFEHKILDKFSKTENLELRMRNLEIEREFKELTKRDDLLKKEDYPGDSWKEMIQDLVKFIKKCERYLFEAAEDTIRAEVELGKMIIELKEVWPEMYEAVNSGNKRKQKELTELIDKKLKESWPEMHEAIKSGDKLKEKRLEEELKTWLAEAKGAVAERDEIKANELLKRIPASIIHEVNMEDSCLIQSSG